MAQDLDLESLHFPVISTMCYSQRLPEIHLWIKDKGA